MKLVRRILIVLLIVVVVLSIVPFLIPLREDGIAPQQLVDDPDGQFITLQGVSVYYEDKGTPDSPVVILVHGLFGSTEVWRYNVDALADAGYRVIAYDRPGFGLSDKTESFNYAMDNQITLLAQLMDALNIESATVVGHSAGGNVAAHFAAKYPQRVKKLVLVDAAVLAGGPPAFVGAIVAFPPVWRWGRIGLQAYFTRANLESSLGAFYVDPSFLTQADYDSYWRAFQTPNWDVGLLALTRDGGGALLSESAIRTIDAETLIIWGAQDTVTPLSQGQTLDEWLPQSTLTVIEDVGHQPFEEAAERFNEILIAFLK